MHMNNQVLLIGFCGAKAKLDHTLSSPKAYLTVYTHEGYDDLSERISQANPCVAYGNTARALYEKTEKGRHIVVLGKLKLTNQSVGNITACEPSILIREFIVSPQQNRQVMEQVLQSLGMSS